MSTVLADLNFFFRYKNKSETKKRKRKQQKMTELVWQEIQFKKI